MTKNFAEEEVEESVVDGEEEERKGRKAWNVTSPSFNFFKEINNLSSHSWNSQREP